MRSRAGQHSADSSMTAASSSTTTRSNAPSGPWPSAERIILFAGSDGGGRRWAMVCSLITSAKLNGVEPYAYLKDVLERMVAGHSASRLDELLPWNWRSSSRS